MIVIIDNYDSFTYNVFQVVSMQTSEEVRVIRNDEITIEELDALDISHLIISPGPGRPEDAGSVSKRYVTMLLRYPFSVYVSAIRLSATPLVVRSGQARHIKHGVVEEMDLDAKGVFRTIGMKGTFTRYHSLAVSEESIEGRLIVSARAADGEIMGLRHPEYKVEGGSVSIPSPSLPVMEKRCSEHFFSYRLETFPFKKTLSDILERTSMSFETAKLFMEDLTDGELDERQTASILTALAAKGPSAEEIAGCATVLGKKKETCTLFRVM